MKTDPSGIYIRDFNYDLPHDRIAEYPLPNRDESRLLIYRNGEITDDHFYHLHQHLPEHALLVVNNTRVIEARIFFQKETGALIEIFCLEPDGLRVEESLIRHTPVRWKCLIGGASKWKHGLVLQKRISVQDQQMVLEARIVNRQPDDFIIEFSWPPGEITFGEILHAAGAIPLPPYIKREAVKEDSERYQTIFARQEGSVAAPTSALHFTEKVFQRLAEKNILVQNITLHVGAGTFRPVKSETVDRHVMHTEPFSISRTAIENILGSSTIVAVGTTCLRSLESMYWIGVRLKHQQKEDWQLGQWEAYTMEADLPETTVKESLETILQWMKVHDADEVHCSTALIIVPGYRFRIPHALITNFHQPQSTLLLLVSAFAGPQWKEIYDHALQNNYRFLSYGDSSLLWRKD